MLKFRPHHFLCTLGFEGKGYSSEFVDNYSRITSSLDQDHVPIEIVSRTDSICAPCPNRTDAVCTSEAKVQELDHAHAKVLGLVAGEVITWGEVKRRLAEKMTLDSFEQSCAPCSWKSLGACESALKRLKSGLAMLLIGLAVLTGAPKDIFAQPQPLPIDALQDQLIQTNRSKTARALRKAYEALRAKQFSQARKLADALLKDRTFSDYARWISANAMWGQALKSYERKNFTEVFNQSRQAVDHLIQIEVESPYSPMIKSLPKEIGRFEILIANAFAEKKDWSRAIEYFERCFQRLSVVNGFGQVRPDSLGRYARACVQTKGNLCDHWLQKLGTYYPSSSEEFKALQKNVPDFSDKIKSARRAEKLSQVYRAQDSDQASFDAAMSLYLSEHYGQSVKSFRRFLDEYPRSNFRFRARYWLAQALSHEQEHDRAQKLYDDLQKDSPLTYYGLLASFASGRDIYASIDAALPVATNTDPLLLPHEAVHLKRAENLLAEKAHDLAAVELKDFKARDTLSSPFLMYLTMLNYEARNYNNAFSLLGDLIQRGYDKIYSSYSVRVVFPIPNMDLIQKYAAENRLDPILVLSLIKQESAFDLNAVSSSGAQGLMQLMPATAVDTVPDVIRADLAQDETNIRVGTKYLKQVLDRFNGNIVLALAGYNAGPTAADRWIRESPAKRGMLEFIEAIPYRETREYVSAIIRNYFWYSRRLTQDPAKTLNYFWNVYGPPESPPSNINNKASN